MQLEDVVMRVLDVKRISIEKLKHFVSKDALNIEGLGKKVIEKFWDLKFIKFPDDIFNLNFKQISRFRWMGTSICRKS